MESDPTTNDTDDDKILDSFEILGINPAAINGIEGDSPIITKAKIDVSI